jgi:NAD(P)-dependent dehydrogenase (short-subunit alcohol dehydrogenase family)|tara:strand:- start:29 stop:805 length:777 start_codon:yes stop_codon:yes gene_type:complete
VSRFEIKDKVAVVTGGAGGIGTCISQAYANAGAKVVVASRNQENLDKVAAEIVESGGEAMAVVVDITKPEQVDKLIAATVDKYGSLDIMVNNAGGGSRMQKAEDTPYDEWVRLIDFNLTGTFICCMAAGKQMIKQKGGNIINISSIAGTKGNPGMLHYSAAKAGVNSLTNNLAFMWSGHNIRVNCILPGLIATPLLRQYKVIPPDTDKDGNPVPRLSLPPEPEEVADLALFLASDASEGITGEQIPIRRWMRSERHWE